MRRQWLTVIMCVGLCGSAWARGVSDSGTSPEQQDTSSKDTSDTAVPVMTTAPATTEGGAATVGGVNGWNGGYSAADLAGEPGGNAWDGACAGTDGSSGKGKNGKAAAMLGLLLFAGTRRKSSMRLGQ